MADRWKPGVCVQKSDCENLLESDAYRIKDKPGKVSILAGLCLCTRDMERKRMRDLLMREEVF